MGFGLILVDPAGIAFQRSLAFGQGVDHGLAAARAQHVAFADLGEPGLQLGQVDFVLFCAGALGAAVALPVSPPAVVPLLAVIGVGLGVFTPSNNHMIMAAMLARASATLGGLINLARGLGTALGVAAVTLSPTPRQPTRAAARIPRGPHDSARRFGTHRRRQPRRRPGNPMTGAEPRLHRRAASDGPVQEQPCGRKVARCRPSGRP